MSTPICNTASHRTFIGHATLFTTAKDNTRLLDKKEVALLGQYLWDNIPKVDKQR